jgi:hypothetical protein
MDHLAEQSALDLVAGHLGEPAASLAHAHLDGCGDCRALVAQLARTGIASEDTRPVARVAAAGSDATDATAADGPAARRVEALPVERIDEYHLLALLGRGGMGSVYRARDTILDRDVALKLIARTGSELARQRFLTEARAVARIRHPNVVVVHRVGVTGEQPYIVYDLIHGKTFADLARPVPWPKALELAVGVTRGLAAVHACGVLHRDLKPANLMLDEHEDVVLVDFGLAKLGDDPDPARAAGDAAAAGGVAVTQAGVALGTPRYMAPEAWQGAAATPQTDLYSLGVVLHELLAGRVPFAETAAAGIARRVVQEDPAPLADVAPWVPAPLAALVDRCIQRDPARRPASASVLGAELEDLQRSRAFDALERDRGARVPAGNPYPGARPFEWDHQGVLFGRRDELRALVDRVREQPMVVIAGDAGAGKSSLCRAGLLPLLFRGALGGARRWVPVAVVPGARPVAALVAAMAAHVDASPAELAELVAREPERVAALLRAGHAGSCSAHVLFVDPLDDLVAGADPEEAQQVARVIGALAGTASDRARVIATVRQDRLLDVSRLPGLDAAIAPALQLVLPPTREAALREIVVEPARLTGRRIPDDTAHALIAAAATGELALRDLAVRLAELWPGLPATEASEARRA